VDAQQFVFEIKDYEGKLASILSHFIENRDGIHIRRDDDPVFRQYVRELIDLFNDALGANSYTAQIMNEFNYGVSNYLGSPSYKCVENILAVVRASITRFNRNPSLLQRTKAEENLRCRENAFVIHGRDEAK
jgi:hypothetical protein